MSTGTVIVVIISIILSVYDIKKLKVPNIGIILLLTVVIAEKIYLGTDFIISIIYGVITLLIFVLINLYTKGRLGIGDCKYTSIIAFHFGFLFWIEHLIYSSLISLILAFILLKIKKIKKNKPIPFIPFLTLGVILNLLFPISRIIP